MAWRIDKSVVRGEIDNRARGRVYGRIWLHGRKDPVQLRLQGNCWRDMAGCLMTFINPSPGPGDATNLNPAQQGIVGDMTASRKVRVLDVPVEEAYMMAKQGKKAPEHLGNAVYLEWFSEFNGRVVIESADYKISFSDHAWRMTPEEEREQRIANQEAMGEWMERITKAVAEGGETLDELPERLDEFEWEKFLRESDARLDRYMELFHKYKDDPDREQKIYDEMGWSFLAEIAEQDERIEEEERLREQGLLDEPPPLEPNPLTEGVDWIHDEDGGIQHPLSKRAFDLAMDMWHHCDKLGLVNKDRDAGDKDLIEMITQAQTTCAKLAGALDDLGYDELREPGLIVASLKRALTHLNKSLAAAEKVAEKSLIEAARLESFRTELFAIREDMLALMKRFREQP